MFKHIAILFLFLLTISFVYGDLSDANLKAHYTLDAKSGIDTALDNTTYAHDLDMDGTVTFTTGKIDNSMVADTGDCFYYPQAKTQFISYDDMEHFSTASWIYRTGASVSRSTFTAHVVNSGSNQRRFFYFYTNQTSEYLGLMIGDGTATTFNTGVAIAQNTWTFVAFTYDGSRINIYVNGASVLNESFSIGAGYSDGTIGGWGVGCFYQNNIQSSPFFGRIDEHSVWNRSLTSSEISFLYNDGDGYEYPFTPPPTPPNITSINSYDVDTKTASLNGTFYYNDYHELSVYFQLDGVNQSIVTWNKTIADYETTARNLTGLTPNTEYTYALCVYNSLIGEVCSANDTFTTLNLTAPYINIIGAFNITNHEAMLGATVMYADYENMTLTYYLDGASRGSTAFNQTDEFDTSEYFLEALTSLDYATTYEYRLDLTYLDAYNPVGASDTNWINEYRINGTSYQLAFSDGRIGSAGWTALNDRRVTASEECADLCNRFYGTPSLNNHNATLTNTDTQAIYYADAYIGAGNGTCWYIDNTPYDECFIGIDGSFIAEWGGATDSDAQEMNQTIPLPRLIVGTTYNFTTLSAYIPIIDGVSIFDVLGTTARLQGTYHPLDYNSTVPFFRLNAVDLFPKYERNSTVYGESFVISYNLTNLTENTTYNVSFCVGYGLGWALIVCNDTQTFTTILSPIVTFHSPTLIGTDEVTLSWTIDFNGVTNVTQNFKNNFSWIPAHDGVKKTWYYDGDDIGGLVAQTNYTYFLALQYDYDGSHYYLNTSLQQFTTYYENAFDDVWNTLLQGSSVAKILLGFALVLGIIFFGASVFGKFNLEMGVIGIVMFTIIGTIIASLINLFPFYIMLLLIAGSILLIILKQMFFNDGGR